MPPPSIVVDKLPSESQPGTAGLADPTAGSTLNTDKGAEIETKPRTKILKVDRIWDKKARKFRYVKTAKPKANKRFSRNVVTVARNISVQGVFTGEYLVEIRAQFLPAIFTKIYHGIEGITFPDLISLDTDELSLIFHALPELQSKLEMVATTEDPVKELVFELEAVVAFAVDHFSGILWSLQKLPPGHIDYTHVWTLFRPGILVCSTDPLKQEKVCRLRSLPKMKKAQDGSTFWFLQLEYLDFDGAQLGTVRTKGFIEEFEGIIPVSSLLFRPFEKHPDSGSLRVKLIERGKRLLELHGRHLKDYQGHALQQGSEGKLVKFNSHGRVMLDPATLNQYRPMNSLTPSIQTPLRRKDLTDEHMMMLNPLLYGFSFGDKTWGAFAFSQTYAIEWNDSIIDSLVLPQDKKDFIQVLVQTHGNQTPGGSFDDIVKDKGKGLIGLLVGTPGVGKTLTAEVMAEVSHKALYTISSGELGEGSTSVMSRLAEVMELAETWNAVLLLDEADVFLTERDNTNLSRNAITSVFLRHLEYFQGTMLLTTNRLASFDPAFQSRIHFCIEYPNLTVDSRAGIWRIFLKKIADANILEVTVDEAQVLALANLELNGRQIKNSMSISQTFALKRNQSVTLESIQRAISFSQSGWTPTNV